MATEKYYINISAQRGGELNNGLSLHKGYVSSKAMH